MSLYPTWYNANGSNYDVHMYVAEKVSILLSTYSELYYLDFEQLEAVDENEPALFQCETNTESKTPRLLLVVTDLSTVFPWP